MIKKKGYYLLCVEGAPDIKIRISNWPAMPWYGNEVVKWTHEMTIDWDGFQEDAIFHNDIVPTIEHYDGEDNLIQEWELLGIKIMSCDINYDQTSIQFTYEDTKHKVHQKPEWRLREIAAEKVNHTPDVDGIYTWKCEKCSIEWKEFKEEDYDRTQDRTNWPVLCDTCHQIWHKNLQEKLKNVRPE